MPKVFQAPTWSVDLPNGWTAELQADYMQIRLPFPHAELRITPYRDETGRMSAAEWIRVAEHFTAKRGRPVIPRNCGDFVGHETRFDAGSVWIRGWALLAGDEGLDVDYRCAPADAGRYDTNVDAVLSTLRLRRPAT
ncbi:MAG TPA: hypothetical protein VJW73_15050 [Gemmatimonadaceae bacterium]|nr:hypothetical protein [Gemmatimonadaceae bacterium]